jgi:hypothetical protein
MRSRPPNSYTTSRDTTPRGYDNLYDPDGRVAINSACAICDRPIVLKPADRLYCSRNCHDRARHIRERLSITPIQTLRCLRCNELLFEPTVDQKYCGNTCRIADARQSRRDEGLPPRPH